MTVDNLENNSFVTDELPENVEIIGISFRGASKIYYFSANGNMAKDGDNAIVETARGLEYGRVTLTNTYVKRETLVLPLKNVIRIADRNDDLRFEANREKEKDAFEVCQKKILDHKLDMKLIDVEYTFDNSKLLFYFTSDDRVDFRELVKDLAGYFRTRIELRQIGIRDEAKLMGGLGICGRPFCCSTFLPDFVQVSIKMAKEQNLSLNSAKISGACGRLMCCLRYEYDTYQEELRRMPKMDAQVVTPDGIGTVTEIKPLENTVRVRLNDENEKQPKIYHLSVLKPFDKKAEEELTLHDSEKGDKKTGKPEEKSEKTAERSEKRRNDGDRRRERSVQEKKAPLHEPVENEDSVETESEKKVHTENTRKRSRNRHHRGNGGAPHHQENAENTKGRVGEGAEADKKNAPDKGNPNDKGNAPDKGNEKNNKSDMPHNNRSRNHSRGHGHVNGQEKKGEETRTGGKTPDNGQNRSLNGRDNQSKANISATPSNSPASSGRNEARPASNEDPKETGKKNYAPLPSNSIKRGNRSRMNNTIHTKPSAFGEKKDNSEKK